jgi:uncharacterized protein (TIGR03083 family)
VTQPAGEQVAVVYAACMHRITEFAGSLGDDQLAVTVAGTPAWTVVELLSHVVGGPADIVAGNFEGAGSEAWTRAQVEARRGRPVAELLDEWSGLREPIGEVCRSGVAPSLAFDIATHEQDLRGALGLPRIDDDLAVDLVAEGFANRAVNVSAKAGLPALQFLDGAGWSCGEAGGVTVTAPKFELVRTMAGRRSNRQAADLDWSGDAAPYLDLLSPFGPLRDTDVVE